MFLKFKQFLSHLKVLNENFIFAGIGHREHLSSLGIAPLVNLPVGDKLFEHLCVIMDYTVTNRSDIPSEGDLANQLTVGNLWEYYTRATGPLTGLPFAETYIGTGINGDRSWPDVNVYVLINQMCKFVCYSFIFIINYFLIYL